MQFKLTHASCVLSNWTVRGITSAEMAVTITKCRDHSVLLTEKKRKKFLNKILRTDSCRKTKTDRKTPQSSS